MIRGNPLSRMPLALARLLPWAGLLVGLAFTWGVWTAMAGAEASLLAEQQRARTDATQERVERRMKSLAVVLRGAAGFLARQPLADRASFRRFVEGLELQANYPGIQGLGFTEWVPAGARSAHERRLRAEGFPGYRVIPGGPLPADPAGCSAVVYLEPMDARNQRAFGRDLWADPTRREAMARARDTGLPAMSGPVTLYQETGSRNQAGTLMFAPVYRSGVEPATVLERQRAPLGWAAYPFRMEDLMGATLAERIPQGHLELLDVSPEQPPRPLYDSDPDSPLRAQQPHQERRFEVAGRTWLLRTRFSRATLVGMGCSRHLEWILGGTACSLLLFLLLLSLSSSQAGAEAAARRKGEDALASEAQFQALFELSPDAVSITRIPDGHLTCVNAAWETLLGHSREEALDRTGLELQLYADPGDRRTFFARLPESGLVPDFELNLRRKDGTPLVARLCGRVMNYRGERSLVALLRDTTQEAATRAALQESEQRFRTITEESPVALLLHREARVIYANSAMARLLAAPGSEQLLGRSILDFIPGECREGVRAQIERSLADGSVAIGVEERLLRLDGGEVATTVISRRVSYAGEPAMLVFYQDLTPARQALEAEHRARKAESLVLMAGSIAHDFNNLFQALMGNLDLLELKARPYPGLPPVIAAAREVLLKAITLSWKMLDFSGRGFARMQRTQLRSLIAGWRGELQARLGPGRLRLDLAEVPPVLADPEMLRRILEEFLGNAREAMAKAGLAEGEAWIRLFLDYGRDREAAAGTGFWPAQAPRLPATVCLEIGNEGPAPDEAILLRMFDPFFTTRALGRGLGLAMVLGLLRAQEAGIQAVADPDRGMLFRLHFPPAAGD